MTASWPSIPHTYDDYRSLPEDMSRRYELLHGELFMVPAPTTVHQQVSRNLLVLLERHITARRLGTVFYAPVDVILGHGDAREVTQPDILFIAAARSHIIKLHGIEGAPDLAIEILSPVTEERDRGYKRTLYARYGVTEYWIVDPQAHSIEVHAAGLPVRAYGGDDQLGSSLLPGLAIVVQAIFGG